MKEVNLECLIMLFRFIYFLLYITLIVVYISKSVLISLYAISLFILLLTGTLYIYGHKYKTFIIEQSIFLLLIVFIYSSNNCLQEDMKYYESNIIKNATYNDILNKTSYQYILDEKFDLIEYKKCDQFDECYYLLNNSNYYFAISSTNIPKKPFKVMVYIENRILLDKFIDNSEYNIEKIIFKEGLFNKKKFKTILKIYWYIINISIMLLFIKNMWSYSEYVRND